MTDAEVKQIWNDLCVIDDRVTKIMREHIPDALMSVYAARLGQYIKSQIINQRFEYLRTNGVSADLAATICFLNK